MSEFSNYIKAVTAVVILFSVISTMIPDGEMKKYARFAIGLIVIACVLKPISEFTKIRLDDIHIDEYSYNETEYSDRITDVYKSRLKDEIKRKFGIDVQINIDDNYNITEIVTDSEKKAEIEEYLGIS